MSEERPAVVWFNGYFGCLSHRCVVIGETPKRYRVRWLEDVPGRGYKAGSEKLVPMHAVEFIAAPITPDEILTARTAAGMCDTGEMAATMEQAREAIAQSIASMIDAGHWDTCAACGHIRACHDPVCLVDDCAGTCSFVEPHDFSLCNDAALSADADQYEDWLHWRWTCGIGKY